MQIKRDYYLDFIKIVATICIVFHHYQQVTGAFFEKSINFNGGKFYFGYVVELFFVVSGFLMYSYIDKIQGGLSFKDFFVKRFVRLFPLMAIGAISYEIFLVMYQKIYQSSWFDIQVTFWGTIVASLGLQEGWGLQNPCVNNPTWYISVLLLCYVVFYLSNYLASRWSVPVKYFFVFIILLGMGISTYGISLPFLNTQVARGYYAFFFGVLFASFMKNYNSSLKLDVLVLLIIIGIPLLIVYKYEIMVNGLNYIMTFIFYPALIALGKNSLVSAMFGKSWIGTLGKISFDVYIWHNPFFLLLYIFIKIFNWNLSLDSITTMVMYTIVCYLFGTISHYFIEKPIGDIIDKKISK